MKLQFRYLFLMVLLSSKVYAGTSQFLPESNAGNKLPKEYENELEELNRKYQIPIDGQALPANNTNQNLQKISSFQITQRDEIEMFEAIEHIPPELKGKYTTNKVKYFSELNRLSLEMEQLKVQNVENNYKVRAEAFKYHQIQTEVSFIVIHVLLVVGIFLSIVELISSIKTRRGFVENQVDITASGIVVKSSFMSLAYLTISIAFYFLYLKFVYTIYTV